MSMFKNDLVSACGKSFLHDVYPTNKRPFFLCQERHVALRIISKLLLAWTSTSLFHSVEEYSREMHRISY